MSDDDDDKIHQRSSPNKNNDDDNATTKKEDEYDVIICGTDLIQSILSSALSRAGKKVLHCDGNDWYGGYDAVLYVGSTLDLFIEGCEQQQNDIIKEDANTNDNTLQQLKLLTRDKIGDLRLHSRSFIGASNDTDASTEKEEDDTNIEKLSIQDDSDNVQDNEVLNEVEDTAKPSDVSNEEDTKTEPTTTQKQEEVQQQPAVNPMEHGFCFDLTPSLLFASGDAVHSLVKSGVADYLEFKSLKGLYLLMEEENKSSASTRSRRSRTANSRNKQQDNKGTIGNDGTTDVKKLLSYLVPCSKGDVFRSKLLSPIDKRRLMKFLQLISDYGMATQSVEGQSSNTNDTPAEEEDATDDTAEEKDDKTKEDEPNNTVASGEDAIQSINERHLHRGRALSRPQNKATASSSEMDALLQCIRDNVNFADFLTNTAKLPERLSTVVIYALALAPFGNIDVEKYSTKDGVDDLVRHLTALGRFGDTAFLLPMYGSGELSQAFCRSGAVYGSTYMLRRSPLAISYDESQAVKGVLLSGEDHIGASDDVDTDDVTDKELPCKHVIVPSTMISPSNAHETSPKLGRTYRRISIIQGKLMLDQNDKTESTDTEQRHAIIIPPGTSSNKSAIHGVVVDDSAFVAPARKDCTILHLTTTSQEGDDTSDELFVDALKTAVKHLINSQSSKASSVVQECHHISFSFLTGSTSLQDNLSQTSGLHVCSRDQLSLTCDSAFREAERIFQTICPDSDFLALAKKVEDAIVYREEHDSDDEKKVLESACTMVQGGSAAEADELPISDEDVNTEETAARENEHKESGSAEK